MKINTISADSVANALEQISAHAPDFVSLHLNCEVPLERNALHDAPFELHGATSCLGALTQDHPIAPVAAFCITDPDGSYGSACRSFDQGTADAARDAVRAALLTADRLGETPDLVWISATPGTEEDVIAGIQDVIGADVPIIGGSAADNSVEGNWFVMDRARKEAAGLVVTVMFPSTPISFAYHSGYSPTGQSGRVTKIDGRCLQEIDGRPAMEVYEDWTRQTVRRDGSSGPQTILGDSTFWPLGREVSDVSGVPFYLLAHPATAHHSGEIDLFATLSEGEEITFMTGTLDTLTKRAGRVAHLARKLVPDPSKPIAGALMIYCGGCMLAVQSHLDRVRGGVNDALGGAPFLGAYTFGEQGSLVDTGNRHGNLMISCIVFTQS